MRREPYAAHCCADCDNIGARDAQSDSASTEMTGRQ